MTPDRCRAALVADGSAMRCALDVTHAKGARIMHRAFDEHGREARWSNVQDGAASLVQIAKPRKLSALLAPALVEPHGLAPIGWNPSACDGGNNDTAGMDEVSP